MRVTVSAFKMDVDIVAGQQPMHAFDQGAGGRGIDDSHSLAGANAPARDAVFTKRLTPRGLPPICWDGCHTGRHWPVAATYFNVRILPVSP